MSFHITYSNIPWVFLMSYINDLHFEKVENNINHLDNNNHGVDFFMLEEVYVFTNLKTIVTQDESGNSDIYV